MGSTEWYELLVIHEGRHMFQFGQADRRINRLFRLLGGERIQSLAGFLMIPGWFWEGDAVVNETLLSESGRGRQPYFNREIRALLLDGTSTVSGFNLSPQPKPPLKMGYHPRYPPRNSENNFFSFLL